MLIDSHWVVYFAQFSVPMLTHIPSSMTLYIVIQIYFFSITMRKTQDVKLRWENYIKLYSTKTQKLYRYIMFTRTLWVFIQLVWEITWDWVFVVEECTNGLSPQRGLFVKTPLYTQDRNRVTAVNGSLLCYKV
jgi:hypothetical protein